ncbi:hypothetical protein IEI94_21220 [Halomonas sp. ML-15]|uniref:hypothetical protein n=1 Tax=Halomonas sp. ML-15 TaxID=2773305 RepID=UPI001745F4FD|nr:hypothetical protein [Halomonas sp. ML-15]MBD3898381.1 hypothetical protein [Halomonas sp. ML-15]
MRGFFCTTVMHMAYFCTAMVRLAEGAADLWGSVVPCCVLLGEKNHLKNRNMYVLCGFLRHFGTPPALHSAEASTRVVVMTASVGKLPPPCYKRRWTRNANIRATLTSGGHHV